MRLRFERYSPIIGKYRSPDDERSISRNVASFYTLAHDVKLYYYNNF